MRFQHLLFVVPLSCLAAQETAPVPSSGIDPLASIIYCDAIIGTRLRTLTEESKPASPTPLLTATTDKPADRLVIEIDGDALYVHFRDDFEKGHLHWGRIYPLQIVKGSTKTTLIAFGFGRAPKSSTVSTISLNRTSGLGLWSLTKDAVFAKEDPRRDFPDATAMYLSCGTRKN